MKELRTIEELEAFFPGRDWTRAKEIAGPDAALVEIDGWLHIGPREDIGRPYVRLSRSDGRLRAVTSPLHADSDDVAQAYRYDVAHHNEVMSPGIRTLQAYWNKADAIVYALGAL